MLSYIFDLETDGLLATVSTIHSITIRNPATDQSWSCCDHPEYESPRGWPVISIAEGLAMLAEADMLIGHNIIKYDLKVIRKLRPEWTWTGTVRDTLLLTRLLWSDIKAWDFGRVKKLGNKFPKRLIGNHSLEAWGHRLNLHKGDYSKMMEEQGVDPWAEWNPDMQDYGEQDLEVTAMLWQRIKARNYSPTAIEIEHDFQHIIDRMEETGFPFNEEAAVALYGQLVERRAEIEEKLREVFKPWFAKGEEFTPKRTTRYKDPARADYTEGATFTRVEYTEFNPSSRAHVIDRLKTMFGWEPVEFTKDGRAKLDEAVLAELPYPEIEPLAEYFMLDKRIGQLATGNKAWLKFVRADGRLYGRINTVGAVTRRCTHFDPNLSQVPAVKVPFGKECRWLFTTIPGYKLVGADASGLELRCLAHYLYRYDGGAYAQAVISGDEEHETDAHSLNAKALGLDPKGRYVISGKHTTGRDLAKRFIYAFLYGAGNFKIGLTVGLLDGETEELRKRYPKIWASELRIARRKGGTVTNTRIAMAVKGNLLRGRFLKNFPALARLREDIDKVVKKRGHLVAIDGGHVKIRHAHAALNTLLQSAGAISVKLATNILWADLSTRGYVWGEDYALVMHSHDELQQLVKEGREDEVGEAACKAFQEAGERLGFRCPLDGAYKVGTSWAETH